jgi:hypothetical protein
LSINTVKRALRSLPYTEMKALGDQVVATMRERYALTEMNPESLCDTLATLPVAEPLQLENEDVFLARAFTTARKGKKEIVLKPVMTGSDISAWDAKIGDFAATAATVRGAISELLDQVSAYEALTGGGPNSNRPMAR